MEREGEGGEKCQRHLLTLNSFPVDINIATMSMYMQICQSLGNIHIHSLVACVSGYMCMYLHMYIHIYM